MRRMVSKPRSNALEASAATLICWRPRSARMPIGVNAAAPAGRVAGRLRVVAVMVLFLSGVQAGPALKARPPLFGFVDGLASRAIRGGGQCPEAAEVNLLATVQAFAVAA